VLNDLIACGVVDVVRLTEIFRQAQESSIVTNAHRVNGGEMPLLDEREGDDLRDFYLIERGRPPRRF
jgi:exodeoxyribonuclease V alpha subunit